MKPSIMGQWRIVEMDAFEQPVVEMNGPAIIEFRNDGLGRISFIMVHAQMDWIIDKKSQRVE